MVTWEIFVHFWLILTCFLQYSTWINKKIEYLLILNRFFQSKQNYFSFWFIGIQHYSTFYGQSCRLIHFDSLRFDLFYNLNHLLFDSFRFDLEYRLYRFYLTMNHITKRTIRPSLLQPHLNYHGFTCCPK